MDRKLWSDKKSKEGQLKKRRKKNKGKKSRHSSFNRIYNGHENYINPNVAGSRIEKRVNKVFSFFEDTENTIKFFHEFGQQLENTVNVNYEINSKDVEIVTADALIYLMVMIKNYGVLRRHSFLGTLPQNPEAKKVYIESGFLSYFRNNCSKEFKENPEKLRMIKGNKTDSEITTRVIRFVSEKQNKSIIELISLQKIFIEMMSNVVYHAYTSKSRVERKDWYIYAEHIDDFVRIIFVDTGVGIAKTVRKNFKEKLVRYFKPSDSKLMQSGFEGEFRTQTNEIHRGNGLKTIRKFAQDSLFLSFMVISGRGQCDIKSQTITRKDYHYNVNGTVYIFDVK